MDWKNIKEICLVRRETNNVVVVEIIRERERLFVCLIKFGTLSQYSYKCLC